MAFISEYIGRPVTDRDGRSVGTIKDLVAEKPENLAHPVIEAVVVQERGEQTAIPLTAAAAISPAGVPLNVSKENIPVYTPKDSDFFLVRDVLDKQIIDTDGARVVRVNDLEVVKVNETMLVSNVDVGLLGILRRAGIAGSAQKVARGLRLRIPHTIIAWDDVELMPHNLNEPMQLRVPGQHLTELHPADLAEIIADLNRFESREFLEHLDVEHLADTLEEVEPDFQASLVENMTDERVADVLEEMNPDEAADLLAELPKDRSEDLLSLMEADDARDVRKLLAYPEDSAGGIMTTEYIALRPELTVSQALEALREHGSEAETIFYVYVTDDTNHLVGVFSLKCLIFEAPDARIADFMEDRVVTVNVQDPQDEVGQMVAKYDLLAIPVVDDENRMQGIVTADDALDKVIPTAWKKRLPRFYR
ncbi:MAG TPA: CBS domain-containing protein [Anaerolineaceae bacterium]